MNNLIIDTSFILGNSKKDLQKLIDCYDRVYVPTEVLVEIFNDNSKYEKTLAKLNYDNHKIKVLPNFGHIISWELKNKMSICNSLDAISIKVQQILDEEPQNLNKARDYLENHYQTDMELKDTINSNSPMDKHDITENDLLYESKVVNALCNIHENTISLIADNAWNPRKSITLSWLFCRQFQVRLYYYFKLQDAPEKSSRKIQNDSIDWRVISLALVAGNLLSYDKNLKTVYEKFMTSSDLNLIKHDS